MGLKLASISNKVAAAYSVADNLGLLKEKAKGKKAIKQDPTTVINKAKSSKNVNVTVFPEDIGPKYFHMRFKEYSYNAGKTDGSPTEFTSEIIKLPIPSQLEEKYLLGYANEQLGGITGGLVDRGFEVFGDMNMPQEVSADDTISDNIKSGAALSGVRTALTSNQLAGRVAGKLTSFFGNGVENAIGVATGVVENPNTRGLFKEVSLRSFDFTWKLVPRNANELANIRKIINIIRAKIHPEVATLGTLPVSFKFPDIVDFGFSGTLRDVPFKPAAIAELSVNMASDGAAFFQGNGEPVSYEISIRLLEMEQFTREDFE